MKLREYTKWKNETKASSSGLWPLGCHHCQKPFAEDEKFIRIDIEDGFNDEVYGFHKNCFGEAIPALHLSHN